MAQVDIVYYHSGEPVPPAGTEIRRKSIKEMEEYMEHLVMEMKFAGVSTKFESVQSPASAAYSVRVAHIRSRRPACPAVPANCDQKYDFRWIP